MYSSFLQTPTEENFVIFDDFHQISELTSYFRRNGSLGLSSQDLTWELAQFYVLLIVQNSAKSVETPLGLMTVSIVLLTGERKKTATLTESTEPSIT